MVMQGLARLMSNRTKGTFECDKLDRMSEGTETMCPPSSSQGMLPRR